MAKITIPVNPIEIDLNDIILSNGLSFEDFIKKVEDNCRVVIGDISILRQRYPEMIEFEELGIELYMLLNIIGNK